MKTSKKFFRRTIGIVLFPALFLWGCFFGLILGLLKLMSPDGFDEGLKIFYKIKEEEATNESR